MNRQAKSLFRTPHFASLKTFARVDPKLPVLIGELGDGGRALIGVKVADEDMLLALYLTEFELLGARYKIVSFQNIRDELEQGEVDYAQRLIKVLRHEIMNSVTPITSLTQLLEERLVDPDSGCVSVKELSSEEQRDLARSLASIQSRGRGLLRFVQAYGQLANLPRPNFANVDVRSLFDRVHALMSPAFEAGVELAIDTGGEDLTVWADPQQIEQVLINLLKNAHEALKGRSDARVLLRGMRNDRGKVSIQVIDNGPGIDAAQSENVFLPFFTTKRDGTGVGLSVSRQIMLLHKGALKLKSSPGRGAEFTLRFR
jgi:signal transduction histidine kinase